MSVIDFTDADLAERLTAFLDGELQPKEESEFLNHMKKNGALMDKLRQEQSFHEFLRSKINRKPVSPGLIDSIKSKMQLPPTAQA